MSELNKTIGKAGSDSILFAHKAAMLLDDDMVDDALNLCEMGVKKFPSYAEGHYVLGRCYQAFNRLDDAKNEFERTLYFAPGHVRALGALAYVYYKKKLKKPGNTFLLKNALYEPNNRELIEYLESQNLYQQLFKAPIIEEQLSANLDGFLPSDEEKEQLQERLEYSSKTSEETKEILKKEQVDLAREAYKDQDKHEVRNIIDRIEEDDSTQTGIDLSQYANVEDDFSTLMGDFFVGEEEEETTEEESGSEVSQPEEEDQQIALDKTQITEENNAFIEEEIEETSSRPAPESPDEPPLTEEESTGKSFSPDLPLESEMPSTPEAEEGSQPEEPEEKEVLDDTSPKEEQAYSDLLMEQQEGSKVEDMPPFNSEDLDAVNMPDKREEETVEEVDSEMEAVSEKEEQTEEKPADKEPEVEAKAPAEAEEEQELMFIKKKETSDTDIPETEPADEKTVTIKEIMSNPSLVTPTFGEILISQRKFAEARHVFLKLWERHPENPRFKEKVEFLDKLIKLQS